MNLFLWRKLELILYTKSDLLFEINLLNIFFKSAYSCFVYFQNVFIRFYKIILTYILLSFNLGVLKTLIEKCIEGASVISICEIGDQLLMDETSKVYKKEKELRKGKEVIFAEYYKIYFMHCITFQILVM